ncbi:MAG: methyltransferase domain-containing protein [Gammaproteobacteria bacterium]|nr:MAG: methyltransferase domain-containing protein [Gammaproteobacteria bacterium]
MEKNQKEFWDALGKNDPDAAVIDPYDKKGHKNQYIVDIRNRVICEQVKSIGKDNLVLDFGCGSGLTTEYLFLRNVKVVGLDISFRLLSKAISRINNKKLAVLQYDGAHVPIKEHVFDSIVTYVVLNHLTSKEQLVSILRELNRVLKDNGTVFAIEQTRRKVKINKDKSKKQLTIEEFNEIFRASGFSVIRKRILRYGHFPFIYLIRLGLIKKSWYKHIASLESQIGKIYKIPLFDYADTLFVLKKQNKMKSAS